jgi:hypothetical protein
MVSLISDINQMKTVLDQAIRNELISRIKTISESSKPQWGKMNVYQMLKHCTLADEMYLGKHKTDRVFIGRIFGKIALKKVLGDDSPLGKSTPTMPFMKIKEENGDIPAQKQGWIATINEYESYNGDFVHPFFGRMTEEQLGQMAYKHIDHHLRQFGA